MLLIINYVLSQVQLQLLTAIVKLFLKRPTDTQELVQQVLSLATQVSNAGDNEEEEDDEEEVDDCAEVIAGFHLLKTSNDLLEFIK